MEKMNRPAWLLVLSLVLAIVLSACGNAATENNNAGEETQTEAPGAETPAEETPAEAATILDQIQTSGKIRMGTSADYPPFEFHKIIDGKDTILGLDISIAQEIANDLGVELEITDMGVDGLLTALQNGNLDMVLAAVTPDEDRAQSVDFSEIYYTSVQKVVVRAEDVDKYQTTADLAGQKVGAQLGTVQEGIVKEQMPESELRSLTKVPDLVLDLKSKNIEAVVLEEPIAEAYVKANPELAVSSIELEQTDEGFAVALPKNSPELVEAVNATLQRLEESGQIAEFFTEAVNAMENE